MKYIIRWDYGCGDMFDAIEAENEEDARKIAYEQWRQDAEDNADYDVVGKWSQELADDYGV